MYSTCAWLHQRLIKQGKATQQHWDGSLSLLFKEKVSCPKWDLKPRHSFSRPVLCPLSYWGSSVAVGRIRHYKARQVSPHPQVNRRNSNLACTCTAWSEQNTISYMSEKVPTYLHVHVHVRQLRGGWNCVDLISQIIQYMYLYISWHVHVHVLVLWNFRCTC